MLLKSLKHAALFAAIGFSLASAPTAQATDIKLGHVLAASHSWHKAAAVSYTHLTLPTKRIV